MRREARNVRLQGGVLRKLLRACLEDVVIVLRRLQVLLLLYGGAGVQLGEAVLMVFGRGGD